MRYETVARLGRGGMGVVDLATDASGAQVALKRLTLVGSADHMERARQRLLREAELLARLDHPNIVRLIDVLDDGGEVVLVMPYLPGGTLADRVRAHGNAPVDEVERLADALCGALAAAHRAGVVHRDIKPANVLFDEHGEPHLADFGVASARDVTDGLTATGTVVGTPEFMAPEQARGEPAGRPADVFALGATLLWASTGEGPWGGGVPALLLQRAARGKVRPVPRHLGPGLRPRLAPMLDPRPDRRPTAAAIGGGPAGTVALTPVVRPRRRWPLLAAGGAAATALLAVVGLLVTSGDGEPAAASDEPVVPVTDCTPLPFQPCGEPPAPGTDGTNCLPGHADYDGDRGNGCEAVADGLDDGELLVDRVEATVVPVDDVDRFTVEVRDDWQLLCDGTVRFVLTAPTGMALGLEVRSAAGDVLGEGVSADGVAVTVEIGEPSCFIDDAATLDVVVRPIGSDRTGAPYVLERDGNW